MRCFWDERQRAHAPAAEFFNGKLHPAAEHEGRVDAILAAIGATEQPEDCGMEPLLRVHGAAYLDLLRDAHSEWIAAGREGDAFPLHLSDRRQPATRPVAHRRAARPAQLRYLHTDRTGYLGC